RTGTIGVPKFPAQFTVSDLTATPPGPIDAGGSTALGWSGSPAGYTLDYDPGSGSVSKQVGNEGPYEATDLTRFPDVIFTLVVSLTVEGQDVPLVTQRQEIVQVNPAAPV